MKHFRRFRFVLWLSLVVVAGCTSGPELQKYPRTQMDRPYTLPKGVATWETLIPTGYFSDNTGSFFLPPIPIPLFWKSSLSDDWTLNWVPLPLSISHQFSYSKEAVWGATFGLGFGYASSIGLVVAPSLSLYQRTKLGEKLAWETTPGASAQFKEKGGNQEWQFGLTTGPLFQLSDRFALSPTIGISVANGYRNAASLADLTVAPLPLTRVTVPLSLKAAWSLGRQWDMDTSYSFYGIGHANGYRAHVGVIHFVHYW